jgi:aminoglycoside phosphotransferase (APT) family kinase protein
MVTRQIDVGQPLLDDLRERLGAPGLAYAEPPREILTGAENAIFALRLRGGPPELEPPLILRCYPPNRDPARIRCEALVQRALALQGYPAPRVPFFREDRAALGGAYLLMERIPGRVLLGELTHMPETFGSLRAGLRSAPRMGWEGIVRAPRELARWMLRLHALDPAPVAAAVEKAGFALEEFTPRGRLARFEERAAASELDGLAPAFAWLRDNDPGEPAAPVLCHGDFHFLNMIVEGPSVAGIVDWSAQHLCFADRSFDVGNTRALFDLRVPGLPAWARPAFEAVQWRLREGFARRYLRAQPLDPAHLRWAEVYRYTREMVGAGESLRKGHQATLDFLAEGGNPWTVPEVRASVLAGIERRTGARVWLREAA